MTSFPTSMAYVSQSSVSRNARTRRGFADLKVFTKIMLLSGIGAVACVAVGLIAEMQMNSIGRELHAIGTEDIPLTRALSELELGVKKQELLLERMMRTAGVAPAADHPVGEMAREFAALQVDVVRQSERAVALAKDGARLALTDEDRKVFQSLSADLAEVSEEVESFERQGEEISQLIVAKRIEQAAALAQALSAGEEKLDKDVDAALHKIQDFTEAAIASAEEHEKAAFQMILGATTITVLGTTLLAWLISLRYIATPLKNVTDGMVRLSAGDVDVHIDYVATDEVGTMASTFEAFRQRMVEIKRLEAEKIAQEERAAEDRRRLMREMADEFERQIGAIVQTVASAANELHATSSSMARVAGDTSGRATSVAAAAEEASANVGTVAAATEELSASIEEIGRQVGASTAAAKQMATQATDTDSKVKSLVEAVTKIGQVVALINNIAEQTNLLALNATIEAARAGDAGKGFSVVASEVKSLANQTSKATEEIVSTVNAIQQETEQASRATAAITVLVDSIMKVTGNITAAIEQQNAATMSISQNIQEASGATIDVSRNIQSVCEGAGETETIAGGVMDAAQELSRQSIVLNDEVRKFLAKVREG